MNSHELARRLLELPDLPVATHANNHCYASKTHRVSHGDLRICTLETYGGQHIVIGNVSKRMTNYPNGWISDVHFDVKMPDEWERYDNGQWKRSEPYAGKTLSGSIAARAHREERAKLGEPIEVMLHGDGVDRYSTGTIEGIECVVDARGGPPEPQFGGRWCGRAWKAESYERLADTGYKYDTLEQAMEALNWFLKPHGRKVVRP